MTANIARDLVDDDGENRAVRAFLLLYGGSTGGTVGEMRRHMDRSGWPLEYCPEFARLGNHDAEHLTKAGAQLWIRHLFAMESAQIERLTTAQAVPPGWKLVPCEPTEDMVIEGFESVPDRYFDGDKYPEEYDAMSGCQQAAFRAKRCYAAMLAAAPAPPGDAP